MQQQSPPPLLLSSEQLAHYQQEFKLSYHLNYLEVCRQRISLQGLDVLEVGGAMPASLVIDHLGCNSWTGVEAPGYDEELGVANQFHRNAGDRDQQQLHQGRYRHIYRNIEDIESDHFGQYDLIFSIACFEHIARLPLALEVMHRCLRPGGKLFTMHSPIWSAFDGHHLPIGIPERFDCDDSAREQIFGPWGHLLQTRKQTYEDILKRFDRDFAEEIIYYAYNSNHINRYFSEDYLSAFQVSSFAVVEHQITFPCNPSPSLQQALEQRYPGYAQFGNNGILALLQRTANSQSIGVDPGKISINAQAFGENLAIF